MANNKGCMGISQKALQKNLFSHKNEGICNITLYWNRKYVPNQYRIKLHGIIPVGFS